MNLETNLSKAGVNYMSRGKIIKFTDGSQQDIKALTDSGVITISDINLDDIVLTFDGGFQSDNFGLDGNNPKVLASMDTLRRSINLYGQISPILVSVIDEDEYNKVEPHFRYQIIDGLKRYYLASNDKRKTIKAFIIGREVHAAKSILRLLANQRVAQSPETILDEAKIVRSSTEDIQESFIEQIFGMDLGSIQFLTHALEDRRPAVVKLINRFRNNEITLNSLTHKLELLGKKEADENADELEKQVGERSNGDKIKAQSAMDAKRGLDDMKVKDPDSNINDDQLAQDKDFDKGSHHSARETEDVLRAKQNKSAINFDSMNEQREQEHRQYIGDRRVLPKSIRMAVLNRDDFHCQVCGRGGRKQPALVSTFEIHHLYDVQLGGKDEVDNLILLCRQCHSLITNHKSFPTKPIPNFVPEYEPQEEELDNNPNMWTIMALADIEKIGYEEALNQINNIDHQTAQDVKHFKITIGKAIKKVKDKLIIEHQQNPYELFKQGIIELYKEKAPIGYTVVNQDIREQALQAYQNDKDKKKDNK